MIYIPKKNTNTVAYSEALAKKMNHVIIVNDKQSSNIGDLFSIWNQKAKVFISSEMGDFYDFINDNSITEKTNILITGAKNTTFETIEEYYSLLQFYLYYKKELPKYTKQMKKINRELIDKKDNHLVAEAVNKFININSDGKYIRALLLSVGYKVGTKREDDNYLALASAYETFQSSILIHDDIIDEADLRRGKATIHKAYSDEFSEKTEDVPAVVKKLNKTAKDLALCIGDLGFYYTNKILLKYYEEDFYKIYSYYNEIVIKTIKGEILDVALPFYKKHLNRSVTAEEVGDVYRLKTAWYSVIGPFNLGLVLARAKKSDISRMEKILEPLGIAFQIKDDILAIYGDNKLIAKSSNSDIDEYKQTILFNYAIKTSYKERLEEIYSKKTASKSDVEEVKKIFIETGSLDNANKWLDENLETAKKSIKASRYIPKYYKDILLGFVSYLKLRER